MHRCQEQGCEEKFDDFTEFLVHKSYHDYHKKIKAEGKKRLEQLDKRFSVQIKCPLTDSLDGYYDFPQLPLQLVCEWHDCRVEFPNVELFYDHVSNHAHKLVDRCYWTNCNKILKNITSQLLREHLRVHTLQKLFACPYCGNFFSTRIKFDDHFLRHLPLPNSIANNESVATRCVSSKDGELKFDTEAHNIDGNSINIFRCKFENCDKAFLTSSLLREHARLHSNKNRCSQCSYVAKTSSRLESHMLYKHQTGRHFECTICLKTFKSRGDLRAHVRRHQIVEPYKCDRCDFETLNEEGLVAHAKLHDRNHDYCCHLCQRVFSRGNNLSRHLRMQHKFSLPDGQSRFRYKLIDEGVYLLDTAIE